MKYYVPELEEFYIGFEYEVLVEAKRGSAVPKEEHIERWEPQIATKNHIVHIFTTWPNVTRVKYLDQEDIESLGFEILRINKKPLSTPSEIWYIRKILKIQNVAIT